MMKAEKIQTLTSFEHMTLQYQCSALRNLAVRSVGSGSLFGLVMGWLVYSIKFKYYGFISLISFQCLMCHHYLPAWLLQ